VGLADTPEFQASKGWIARFKSRACLHNIKLTGESASTDKGAAQEFAKTFPKITEEVVCSDCQIFNVDELGLFWKNVPAGTCSAMEEAVHLGIRQLRIDSHCFLVAV
jgi:hypothetical protein